MRRTTLTLAAAALVAAPLTLTGGAASAADGPPRPGCGYGDDQHNHQAAPGLDPLGLRPGIGTGDEQHPHTTAPGQAPDGAGAPGDPMRGCRPDPRG